MIIKFISAKGLNTAILRVSWVCPRFTSISKELISHCLHVNWEFFSSIFLGCHHHWVWNSTSNEDRCSFMIEYFWFLFFFLMLEAFHRCLIKCLLWLFCFPMMCNVKWLSSHHIFSSLFIIDIWFAKQVHILLDKFLYIRWSLRFYHYLLYTLGSFFRVTMFSTEDNFIKFWNFLSCFSCEKRRGGCIWDFLVSD